MVAFAIWYSAQENCTANKRQTIGLKDVLQALRETDFEHFIGPIEDCLRGACVTCRWTLFERASCIG